VTTKDVFLLIHVDLRGSWHRAERVQVGNCQKENNSGSFVVVIEIYIRTR
jgi:hypothetical protein